LLGAAKRDGTATCFTLFVASARGGAMELNQASFRAILREIFDGNFT
jgi:hypothetical protein